jgi:hypothetical protein
MCSRKANKLGVSSLVLQVQGSLSLPFPIRSTRTNSHHPITTTPSTMHTAALRSASCFDEAQAHRFTVHVSRFILHCDPSAPE